jgi:hypothetical protein
MLCCWPRFHHLASHGFSKPIIQCISTRLDFDKHLLPVDDAIGAWVEVDLLAPATKLETVIVTLWVPVSVAVVVRAELSMVRVCVSTTVTTESQGGKLIRDVGVMVDVAPFDVCTMVDVGLAANKELMVEQ